MFQIFRVNIILLIVLLFSHSELMAGNDTFDGESRVWYHFCTEYDNEHTAQYEIQEAEYELVDEGSVPRRYQDSSKVICCNNRQQYIDFLHCIFPVIPIRGAPRENEGVPKQLAGYGMLYLQYLF